MAKRQDAVDLDEKWRLLLGEASVRLVSDWFAATSLWTCPEVARAVPLVFPKTRRLHSGEPFRSEVNGLIVWRNEPAAAAFWKAYGVSLGGNSPRSYKNAEISHVYEESAHHPEHYTRLANLVAVPRALVSLSEWAPVRDLLKWKSWDLYGYSGPTGQSPTRPGYVPAEWPGVKRFQPTELTTVIARMSRLNAERPAHTPRRPPEPGTVPDGSM